MDDQNHVADYFIISGVPENPEVLAESKLAISSVQPITDITVIFRGLGEKCPAGYTCIETTPGGHQADLNNGNFKSPNILICYRRGEDKPPLVDVGVYHEDKDRVLPDVEVVYQTPYGRCASTGNTSAKSGTFITYRRAKTNSPYNQLVVVDLCVILNNKSEHPPHAFYSIRKNLNKSIYGMIGSEVFLCYKKTLLSPASMTYEPQIISRFPLQDYSNFPLPHTVPLFCLPTGANIELWPNNTPIPRPVPSTFVLTSDLAQKIYGSALSFYEVYDKSLLNEEQKLRLGLNDEIESKYEIYAIKSICILSRWPFFDCFEKFLTFLHRLVFYQVPSLTADMELPNQVPLEHYISHFLLDVSFPTQHRPTVLVQLMPGTDETVAISQPSSRLPLPLTGASFTQLLSILGVDNTMNVLLFGLSEQKILLHSLRPGVLTGVAEAITAALFPFHWQCPYVPLCPLSLHGILNAPLPFIVGIDSRCFDGFTPPDDIICLDLDTKSIFLSETKKCLNLRILPKRAARVLRASLEKIFHNLQRIVAALGPNSSPQHRLPLIEANRSQLERKLDLEIQEAFLRFMATILRGFRTYLLPITRAPTVGATDPTSLFNFEGFLHSRDRTYSQFYQIITKTQMFTHYIEERSFVSDKDTSLAFFDDCEEKLISSDDIFSDRPIKLFDKEDGLIQTDRSVYIPAPEQSPSMPSNLLLEEVGKSRSAVRRGKFGPLNAALFHRHPQSNNFLSLDRAMHTSDKLDHLEDISVDPSKSFSISRRTKQEIKASRRLAKKSCETPLNWSKYLVSCCYSLWFSSLPSYITYCKSSNKSDHKQAEANSKSISRILRYAHSTIVKMQRLQLTTDEICFRVLTLLCGHYGQPALAVRVFFEMKKAGIKPNAVTYGYYNKAVLESKWPDLSSKPTTVLWTKVRNVINGIALFKTHGRFRRERRDKKTYPPVDDSSSAAFRSDVVDKVIAYSAIGDFFHPTTIPIDPRIVEQDRYVNRAQHRRSLVNRSFSSYQKTSTENLEESFDSRGADGSEVNKFSIHKSYSMHLQNGSMEPSSPPVRERSSSLEDEEEQQMTQRIINPIEAIANRRAASAFELYKHIRARSRLFTDSEADRLLNENILLVESPAGLLFTASKDSFKSILQSTNGHEDLLVEFSGSSDCKPVEFLRTSNLAVETDASINDTNAFLKSNSFGEDIQILRNLEPISQKPDLSSSVAFLANQDADNEETHEISTDTVSNESQNDLKPSSSPEHQESSLMLHDQKSLSYAQNFKLSSFINDASSSQWYKWTSSQNPKNYYKGIKSAATGIVSSLQEIKSSFSISNSNTPAKLLNSAHHRSTATREIISHWANYFSSQPSKVGEDNSDSSSLGSNDLLRLSNFDEDPSAFETIDMGSSVQFFDALEKSYGNALSKEDLLGHLSVADQAEESKIALDIKITTCSRCTVCHALLYDEEIMERWSYNESNLNTKCVYCRAKIVPLMTIIVEDHRFESARGKEASELTTTLVDLGSDTDISLKTLGTLPKTRSMEVEAGLNFVVPYLSPIVLRKELESVFEGSSDHCVATSNFMDEHPIIFWNLLWYFSRINVPTHLALLCLQSKSILSGRQIPDEWAFVDTVRVHTLWDNEKLHSEIGKPLYKLLDRGKFTRLSLITLQTKFKDY